MHDPKTYPDPHRFMPERWLTPEMKDTFPDMAFGFGRRLCPGIHLVQSSLFIMITNILATFHIRKGLNENGREVEPDEKWTTGMTM